MCIITDDETLAKRRMISRLTGEVWYRDVRDPNKVLGLPYTVVTNDTKCEFVSPHGHRSPGVYSTTAEYVPCDPPDFPLPADVWDYEIGHWRHDHETK